MHAKAGGGALPTNVQKVCMLRTSVDECACVRHPSLRNPLDSSFTLLHECTLCMHGFACLSIFFLHIRMYR